MQILVILWEQNNWMSPNDAFRVTGSYPVFEELNLSTEIQFLTNVAYLSNRPVCFIDWWVAT